MTLSLPESCFDVLNVAFASLNIYLVERDIDRNVKSLSICFPEGLLIGMEILADSILTGVPKADSLDQVVTDRVV